MRPIIPVVMAGVLGIYGLITAVIINGKLDQPDTYSAYSGYAHLGAGLTVGMSSLAAGLAIGIVGDAGVRANAQQPRLFVGMIQVANFVSSGTQMSVHQFRLGKFWFDMLIGTFVIEENGR